MTLLIAACHRAPEFTAAVGDFADIESMNLRGTNIVRRIAVLLAAVPLVCSQSIDVSETRSRILALERAWNKAEATHDMKVLDGLFDRTLVYVDSDGSLMTKSEILARIKSASVAQISTESMNVQVFGKTAIVVGVYRALELQNGKVVTHKGRFIDSWVYENSTWVCVAAQSTSAYQ